MLTKKDARSEARWAESARMARLLAKIPPTISMIINRKHTTAAMSSLRRAPAFLLRSSGLIVDTRLVEAEELEDDLWDWEDEFDKDVKS